MLSPSETIKAYSEAGVKKLNRPVLRMFILAIFAGIFIALGATGNLIAPLSIPWPSLGKLASATMFPVGLIFVTFLGAELFTGNNMLIMTVIDRKASVGRMFLNWGVVYAGNFVGSMIVVLILTYGHVYSLYNNSFAEYVMSVAQAKVSITFAEGLLRGILCNVIVCATVLIAVSAKSAAGKILAIFPPIALFVVSGYEHCVANMYFIPAAIFTSMEYGLDAGAVNWGSMIVNNLIPVTIGNIIGGALIIGVALKFAVKDRAGI